MTLGSIKKLMIASLLSITGGARGKILLVVMAVWLLLITGFAWYWSIEPNSFPVQESAKQMAASRGHKIVEGYTTVATLYRVTNTLLTKSGGYLSNDIMPPGVFLDNMQNWEHGVLTQVRDMARALRRDFSRYQSQSKEDPDLAVAEPQFNFSSKSWMLPATETEYQRGLNLLDSYMSRLSDKQDDAQIYTRADNLSQWLADVETRLGSLSQRLSACVGKSNLNTYLEEYSAASQLKNNKNNVSINTPWSKLDDIFYEARGTSWALIHLLHATEIDFIDILKNKNAQVSLKQIIWELENTQGSVWSPMILNGSGFGLIANHSLVMANYISRANAAMIELRRLLEKG
ncbi:MAG: DUF2333 family protein [Candidatus Endonucleobacter bathymodioli]|uniref:DUF2333 family protein n=1 Tax=Candidatus Endonucleibacter bathymodioli TaxID=539814 RepID=A0AA90NS26_9GAMM|nr:DUF2333 family protein [Candidatus Endonucleobacter bathymodioli]